MTEVLEQRIVTFYSDEIVAVQHVDGTIFVPFVRLCDNLGLNQQAQARRIQRHAVLQKAFIPLVIATAGGPQTMQCLKLSLLPLWLSGIQASRVKAELQERLILYQAEAADVLWQAFKPQILTDQRALETSEDHAIQQLHQIADMGHAIARMAEQQIELQRQQKMLGGRVDTAARVIQTVQGHLANVEVRLGVLEDQLHPTSYITDVQATEVSNLVKALGELLSRTQAGKNHYQGIFAELYRRFGVSSYKLIRQEQYAGVLAFLEEWQLSSRE